MIRSFIFSEGRVLHQDAPLDVLRVMLVEDRVHLWVDAEGSTPEETKQLLESVFKFHPLAIEDCLAASERPKADDYESYLFMVIHAVDYRRKEEGFCTTELNLFIGKNFVVSVHRDPLRSVTSTRDRVLAKAASVARAPDRLTYHILDSLLGNYGPALEELSEEIADLEDRVLTDPSFDVLTEVLRLKREVQRLRQILAPQREVLFRVAHGEFKIVRSHLLPYYRDLLDQLGRIGDAADAYRDALTNVLQIHLNLQQMKVNQVTKVLAVLATLATPFLIVTGFYGMNLQHMPSAENLPWPLAYAYVLGLCMVLMGLIYGIMKKKRWL